MSVLDFYMSNTRSLFHARNKKSPARYMPENCAEISKVTSGGGNWILRDLDLQKRKHSIGNKALVFVYEIRL